MTTYSSTVALAVFAVILQVNAHAEHAHQGPRPGGGLDHSLQRPAGHRPPAGSWPGGSWPGSWPGAWQPRPRCGRNEKFRTCVSSTCTESKCGRRRPFGCTADCVTGCFCKPNFYRRRDGACVQLKNCHLGYPWPSGKPNHPGVTTYPAVYPDVYSPNQLGNSVYEML